MALRCYYASRLTKLPLAVTSSEYSCSPRKWANELMLNVLNQIRILPTTPPQMYPPIASP